MIKYISRSGQKLHRGPSVPRSLLDACQIGHTVVLIAYQEGVETSGESICFTVTDIRHYALIGQSTTETAYTLQVASDHDEEKFRALWNQNEIPMPA